MSIPGLDTDFVADPIITIGLTAPPAGPGATDLRKPDRRPPRGDDVRPAAGSRLALRRPVPFGLALGPIVVLAVWIIGSATGFIDKRMISAPWTVVTTAGELIANGRLQDHFAVSASST